VKTLSKNQIEELYVFTRKHYVEWYDVQTELVDHLANGIERQWEINSNISFKDALNAEFKKFGIFGFSELVENKQRALNKYYRSLVFKELKTYLRLPSFLFLIITVYAFKTLLSTIGYKAYVLAAIIVLMLAVSVCHMYREKKAIKRRYANTGKKWLFDAAIMELGGFVHVSFLLIQVPNFDRFSMLQTGVGTLLVSTVVILYFMVFYISTRIVPKIIKENMKNRYQELYV
jgi:hypothetical protein